MKTFRALIAGLLPLSSTLVRRIAFPLLLLSVWLMLVLPCEATPFEFENTGSMTTARYGHTATLLQNGEMLVAGGFDSNGVALASAELYDPASGTWVAPVA
jgi:Galactose oxidase, central domain